MVYGAILLICWIISLIIGDWFVVVGFFLYFIVGLGYMVVMPATNFQGTFGKVIMGVKIIDENDEKVTVGRSALRYVGMMLSGMIMYIGYIMIAFHPEKKGLHDIIAKTYVVTRN